MTRLSAKLLTLVTVLLFTLEFAYAQQTVTITNIQDALLYNNTRPGYESTRNANYGSHIRISALAWTNGGSPSYFRNMIRFELSTIPTGAIIQSAMFYLYSDPTITSGSNSNTGSNAFYLEKVTQSWDEFTVNWNNQPSTTTTDRVWTGPSSSTTENRQVDLTTLVQQWVSNPSSNFGLKMILENEVYYRSRNYASSNHSNASIRPKIVVTYQIPVPPPDAPSSLAALATSASSIALTWMDNSDNETGFQIERSINGESGYSVISTTASNITSFTDTDLASGIVYYYRVRAINSTGGSPYTNEVGAQTFYIPPPPTGLTAHAASNSSITLNWTDNSNNEAAFQIERSLLSDEGFTVLSSTGSDITTFSDNNLEFGVTYYYRVRAVNLVGASSFAEASATIWKIGAGSLLDDYGFQYRYDGRKRMIMKKVPGADWVYMVYDDRDRLVFTQDGKQRTENKWAFIKYDAWNRPIMTGVYSHGAPVTRDAMSGLVSKTIFFESRDNNAPHGYTNTVFSDPNFVSQSFEVLTVTYYDDYSFKPLLNDLRFDYNTSDYGGEQYSEAGGRSFETVAGQVTATKAKVLGENWFIWSVNYFDNRYRLIQNVYTNVKGEVDRNTNIFDFTGRLIKSKTVHNIGPVSERTVAKEFDYDHAGRLKRTWYAMNGQAPVLLSMNTYNELGELITKNLHNEDSRATPDAQRVFKQDVDYQFNIRGWITRINDLTAPDPGDLLEMNFYYDTPMSDGGPAQFNGNISQVEWSGPDGQAKSYGFSYDPLNRLTKSEFSSISRPSENGRFNEQIQGPDGSSGYDLNGNILYLQRAGKTGEGITGIDTYGEMDNLMYTYHGNQLMRVSDAATPEQGFIDGANGNDDYSYDANGNLVIDRNKAITGASTASGASEIKYNHLNLPEKVVKTTGEYIKYTYDASGRKLKQQVFNADGSSEKTTEYADGFIYEDNALKFVMHEEGRLIITDGAPEFQYFLKDHLGNVRVTFTSTPDNDSDKATLEPENESEEYSKFVRYEHARKVRSYLFDRTNGTSPTTAEGYAQRLSGSANEKFGLARSLSVMPGDKVTAEVYAKYIDPVASNRTSALNALLGQIAQQIAIGATTAGLVIDGQTFSTSTVAFPFPQEAALNTAGSGGLGPKAYLNWLVFDHDYNLILGKCGYMRLSGAPKETGQDVAHEMLSSPIIEIDVPGFVYIYLSNENDTPIDVFFDDFKVDHLKSPLIEMNDYYPFGLTFNSYQRENLVPNRFKFGGKEEQTELALNTIDWGWRQYDPAIGRWSVVDQWAEKYNTTSPYAFVKNNPVLNREIDGRYFEGRDEKRAAKLERKAEKRADKLERKADRIDARGGDSGDMRGRVAELRQSGQDIRDMRGDQTSQYRYAKLGGSESTQLGIVGPTTSLTGQNARGHNVVTMFTESNMGSKLHESRHGGQNVRGEYNIVTGAGYGVADEISAYRAQYAYTGKLTYVPRTDFNNPANLMRLMTGGVQAFQQTMTNINQITPAFVNSLVDSPGLNQQLIYPPAGISIPQWNSN